MIQKERHLHILQMLLKLNPVPIISSSDEELLVQVQKLEQIESYCGFLPIWKGSKKTKVKEWEMNRILIFQRQEAFL